MASGLLDKANIILTPTGYKAGTMYNVAPIEQPYEDFVFSRASVASRVNSSGLVEMVGRTLGSNLVQNGDFSEIGPDLVQNGTFDLGSELVTNGDFATDSDWTKGTGWSISDGSASYDGSGTGYQFILQGITTTSGSTYKINFDVLSSTGSNLNIVDFGAVRVNQTHLTAGNYTYYAQADASSENLVIYANGTDTFSITNVSVQEVIDTNNIPRINYDSNGENGHWLLEPTSTNLITYSEDFSEWTPTNATTTQNVVTSPDGTVNANKIIATSTTGQHRINFTSSNVSGSTTFSFFAKSAEYNSCWARIGLDSGFFDLENGLTSANVGITSNIVDYGNGWYKCTITKASSSANEVCRINITTSYTTTADFLGDNTSGIYVYGAQHEQLSYATSYIPSLTGSTVTRATETANGAGSATLINSTEGVLYVEALMQDTGTFKTAARITATDTSTTDGMWIYFKSDNKIQSVLRVGGVDQTGIQSGVKTTNQYYKVAFKFKQNDFALWIDGTEVATDTSGNTFSADTLSAVGFVLGTSTNPFYGKVKALTVFNTALTDAELTELTS